MTFMFLSYTGIAFAIYIMLVVIAKPHIQDFSRSHNITCGFIALFWMMFLPPIGWFLLRIAVITPNFDISDFHRVVHDRK